MTRGGPPHHSTRDFRKTQVRESDSGAGAGGVPLGFVHEEPARQDQQAALETCPPVAQNLCKYENRNGDLSNQDIVRRLVPQPAYFGVCSTN